MNRISKTCHKYLQVKMPIKINKIQTQYGNSECGVYCMRYLEGMVQGKTFEDITKSIVSDKDMNNWRDHYFETSLEPAI